MKSKIDEQLEKIIQGDTSSLLDNHNETNDDQDDESSAQPPQELVPIVYDRKPTKLELSNKDLQEDYEFARSNLYGLIGRSNAALDLALKISAMSEHPRALEVVVQLIRASSDVSKELIQIHRETNKKQSGSDSPPDGKYTQINNNFYNKEPKDISSILDEYPDEKDE